MTDLTDQLSTAVTDRYRLERELGRGGMATVFLAQDLKHHRRVAIKVLRPELTALLGQERFLREIETAARLQHPHILHLLDSGEARGLLYYVMPYVEGESLRERLAREQQLPIDEALRLAREVADALDHAHRAGVVHRDIKPENILLQAGHAVVADFGIARAVSAAGGTKLTTTGTAVGTPAYMSPEQVMGSRDLDGRSDLYSLGCVLYEMLAGVPPFAGAAAESLVYQHLSAPPPPVTSVRPSVPEATARAIAKCLAKTPADRFGTAAEFAKALGAPMDVAKPAAPPRRRRWLVFAASAAAFILLALVVWRFGPSFTNSAAPIAGRKDWILVAEFDGPPDDSSLAVTTRDLVSAALDQSAIVATVPLEQIRIALKMAGRPSSTRVDAELARQLAYRSAVRTVVEGKIGRLGPGYSVILRVVDAENLKVVLTERAVAKNEDALIPAIGRLVERLRASLGENRSAILANHPPDLVATPSYEAYQLYVRGMHLHSSGSYREAIHVFREALELDPDFAYAWRRIGVAFGNIDQPDSGLAALDQALRRPHRLTAIQRLEVEALRASDRGDLRSALAGYDRILQADSSARVAGNRGYVLEGMGRLEEALEWTRVAQRGSPFGVPPWLQRNEIRQLLGLGRLDEAREVAQEPRPDIEIRANNWAAAERIAGSLLAEPGLDDEARAADLLMLASAQSARGAFRAAARAFERVEEVARAGAVPTSFRNASSRGRLMLTIASGGALPLPADSWTHDSSTASLLTRGLRSAIAGDRPSAQRLLESARARWALFPPELAWQGATPALLEARIEALAGRWDEAARILRPVASQRLEYGTRVPGAAGMSNVRWFLADVFERLGRPDSAATILERVVSEQATLPVETSLRGLIVPFAHRRLVLLYARMGRIEDAKRHWKIFIETVRTPDPEIQPLIAEARAALASAEGMTRSTMR